MRHRHPDAVCPLFAAVVFVPAALAVLPLLLGSWALLIAFPVAPLAFALALADLLGIEFTWKAAARVSGMYFLAAGLCGLAGVLAFPVGLMANSVHDRIARCHSAYRDERRRIESDRPRSWYLDRQLKDCAAGWDPSDVLRRF
jgi:hypothetical protein